MLFLATMINPEAQLLDAELERRIDLQALLLHTVKTPAERATAWSELKRLHTLRSPQRIAQMEREAGLA